MERVNTLKELATRIEPTDTTKVQKIRTLLGPYLSAICPRIGADNPLTSHPIAAAKLIVETFTSQSPPQVSTKTPKPCLVPTPMALLRKSAPTISQP